MLNILKQKNKNTKDYINKKLIFINKDSNYLNIVKHFPATTKE